ncbi:MAG: hypothetical protein RBT16_15290 [Desulfococcus multivorans]|jgi:hypothetical protein|nr:hypothetical protein [Desulfococcus multivorans]
MYTSNTSASAVCDLCGKKSSECPLYINEKFLCVCEACKRKLDELPANARDMLENYLIGNVV